MADNLCLVMCIIRCACRMFYLLSDICDCRKHLLYSCGLIGCALRELCCAICQL